MADQMIGDMVARVRKPVANLLFGYGPPQKDPVVIEIERRIEALRPRIAAEIDARSEEVLELAIKGPVFATPTIHYEIGQKPYLDELAVRYLTLERLTFSSSPSEDQCGRLTTRGWSLRTMKRTDVEAGTWCSWSLPIDVEPLRDELAQQDISGAWLETYEDSGQEHPWARFDVGVSGDRLSVTGATVSPRTLERWKALKVRDGVWDLDSRMLTFSIDVESQLAGEPARGAFHYNLAQVDPDTFRGKVLISRSYDRDSVPEVRDVVFRRLFPTSIARLVSMAKSLLRGFSRAIGF